MNSKKTVLVTGSSRGIGRNCIIEFAKKGYNVVINYNKSKEFAEELEDFVKNKYNVETLVIKADVSNEEEVKKMVEKIVEKFEKIDVLVNNAGISIDKPFEERTKEDFEKTLSVNVIGMFLVTKYVSKYMMEKKEGIVINISSTNGTKYFSPLSIDYDVSKAGVVALTHNFAMQFQKYIRVNAIAPGWVDTDMNKNFEEDFYKEEKEKIFLKRIGKTEDIAKLVMFLSSDDSSYINDEVINIDGGM